jgi:hypothetical protein
MFRKLSLVALGLGATIVTGCSSDSGNGTPVDLSQPVVGDASGNADQGTGLIYMAATPHDIDTGVVPNKSEVKVTGLVVIKAPSSFPSSHMMKCTFQAVAQDPACNTPPCGLYVNIVTPFVASPTDATQCPYPDQSTTFFKDTKVGDTIDVTGAVDSYQPTGATLTEHSIVTDSIAASATMNTVTAIPVTINHTGDTQFVYCLKSACPANQGSGWQTYEGTYIKLSLDDNSKFTVGENTQVSTKAAKYYFITTPGNVSFSRDDAFIYDPKDAGINAADGTTWTSLAGAVDIFESAITPRLQSDFVP